VYTSLGPDAGGGVDFGLAPNIQPKVATSLLNWQAPDTPGNPAALDLQAAMRLDEGAYRHLIDFSHLLAPDAGATSPLNVAAVMFFVNRTPVVPGAPVDGGAGDAGEGGAPDAGGGATAYPTTAVDCNPPLLGEPTVSAALTQEAENAFAQGLQTYFIVLNDQQQTPQQGFYDGIASAGGTPAPDGGSGDGGSAEGGVTGTGVTVLNATSTLQSVFASFQATLASVATCLYDLPAGIDTTASLSFVVPPGNSLNPGTTPLAVPVAQSSGCSGPASTANGWNIDKGRIRLCGNACQELQTAIGAVAAAALGGDAGTDAGLGSADGGTPVIPDVPVNVTMPCSP